MSLGAVEDLESKESIISGKVHCQSDPQLRPKFFQVGEVFSKFLIETFYLKVGFYTRPFYFIIINGKK